MTFFSSLPTSWKTEIYEGNEYNGKKSFFFFLFLFIYLHSTQCFGNYDVQKIEYYVFREKKKKKSKSHLFLSSCFLVFDLCKGSSLISRNAKFEPCTTEKRKKKLLVSFHFILDFWCIYIIRLSIFIRSPFSPFLSVFFV